MTEFLSKKKWVILAIAGIVVLVCVILLTSIGWNAFRGIGAVTPTETPDSFGYCSAELTELCVVSFGRDALGNTIINFYVPIRKYPVFYLKITRQSGEFRYECSWNNQIRTSVYCSGTAMNLGEGFMIQMISQEDELILAEGAFTLNAFRVTTPVVGANASPAGTDPAPVSTLELDQSNTPTGPEFQFVPNTRPTLPASYPSYP